MAIQRLRRALIVAACASSVLLAACGGGSVVSQFSPTRVVAFGDGFSDLGQTGSRYTVNDGTNNIWLQQMAQRYGLTVSAAASGGTVSATGNARVAAKPDAAGNSATPTVTEQINTFLAGRSFAATDLVVLNAGISDVVAEASAAFAGRQTVADASSRVGQAGRDLAAQVRRVVQAGAQRVVVVGTYNLGRSPWATSVGRAGDLQALSSRFNDELLVSIVDLGSNVLYVDAALYFNLVTSSPAGYNIGDTTSLACTSVDPGAGIGIGTGQVSSARCNNSTLRAGLDVSRTLFADAVYPTPVGHRSFGDYAFDRIRARW